MNIKPLEYSSLYCIFCDDIRNEVDGKTSVIGWFADSTQIKMSSVPMMLSKFSMIGILTIPNEDQPSEMKIDLLKDEEVFQSISVPHDRLTDAKRESPPNSSPLRGVALRLAIQTLNLPIERPCTLRMRIRFDSTELYSNGIQFIE